MHQRSSYVAPRVSARRKPSHLFIITILSVSLTARCFSLTVIFLYFCISVLLYFCISVFLYSISSLNLTNLASYDHNVPTPIQLDVILFVFFCFPPLPTFIRRSRRLLPLDSRPTITNFKALPGNNRIVGPLSSYYHYFVSPVRDHTGPAPHLYTLIRFYPVIRIPPCFSRHNGGPTRSCPPLPWPIDNSECITLLIEK